jgi:protein-L-isoaspartate(D-aspartate) O-methyltransferase
MKMILNLASRVLIVVAISFSIVTPALGQNQDEFLKARKELVKEINSMARSIGGRGVPMKFSPVVMRAMGQVPRQEFVRSKDRRRAYLNSPLPIGYGQTISQPYIVALMTDLLNLEVGDVVLEIGTGSGYQAAVLDAAGAKVYTIEIIQELGQQAEKRLQRLGYSDIQTKIGDGYYGWPEAGPFDAILVTAASSHIPPPLIEQLKPGGRMVVPVGPQFTVQQLVLITKNKDGRVKTRQLLPVSFVPLTGKH